MWVEARFYEELNDFLPPDRRKKNFVHRVEPYSTVGDAIVALNVPLEAVDLVLVNGRSVDFSHTLVEGDRISVYPVFESFDITPLARVRPRPLRRVRLVSDPTLRRLTVYLRLLGLDTMEVGRESEDRQASDPEQGGARVWLSRQCTLLDRPGMTHGYLVRSSRPREQLLEVLERIDLSGSLAPLSRCLRCNGPLCEDERWGAEHRACRGAAWGCSSCGRTYRSGPRLRRLRHFADWIVGKTWQQDSESSL